MPELAEVEYHRKIWNPGLGARILRVHVQTQARVYRGEPSESIAPALAGSTLRASAAHGKQMLFGFSGQFWLGVHLGMSGEMLQLPPDHVPQKHDHLVLFQKAASLVFRDPRMFGRLRIHQGKLPPAWWRELPPAVGSPAFTLAIISTALARHPKTPLKSLLLDQRYFPGIGNWMADEILWQARLHPRAAAGSLNVAEQRSLWRILRKVSRTAMKTIGVDWSDPPDDWLIHQRWTKTGICPQHGTELERATIGGRTTAWCRRCQPAPKLRR